MPRPSQTLLSADDFVELADRIQSGQATESRPIGIPDVFGLVREGRIVSTGDSPAQPSLGQHLAARPGVATPYRLSQWTEAGDGWVAVNDRFEIDIHGSPSMTHLDTTEHFSWSHRPSTGTDGGNELVRIASQGLVARGVLIDVPGILGRPVAGQVVTLEDVETVLDKTGIVPLPGDALYFSFGRSAPASSTEPLGSAPTAGLSIECAEWVASIRPSVVVTDEGLDPFPSEVEGLPIPWHVLLLTVLGIPLVDRATLVALSSTCIELDRWTFASVMAPLPIPGASGSPINPLAIF